MLLRRLRRHGDIVHIDIKRTPMLVIFTFVSHDNPTVQPDGVGDIATLSLNGLREESHLIPLRGHGHDADLENWFEIRLELLAAGGETESSDEDCDI